MLNRNNISFGQPHHAHAARPGALVLPNWSMWGRPALKNEYWRPCGHPRWYLPTKPLQRQNGAEMVVCAPRRQYFKPCGPKELHSTAGLGKANSLRLGSGTFQLFRFFAYWRSEASGRRKIEKVETCPNEVGTCLLCPTRQWNAPPLVRKA